MILIIIFAGYRSLCLKQPMEDWNDECAGPWTMGSIQGLNNKFDRNHGDWRTVIDGLGDILPQRLPVQFIFSRGGNVISCYYDDDDDDDDDGDDYYS